MATDPTASSAAPHPELRGHLISRGRPTAPLVLVNPGSHGYEIRLAPGSTSAPWFPERPALIMAQSRVGCGSPHRTRLPGETFDEPRQQVPGQHHRDRRRRVDRLSHMIRPSHGYVARERVAD